MNQILGQGILRTKYCRSAVFVSPVLFILLLALGPGILVENVSNNLSGGYIFLCIYFRNGSRGVVFVFTCFVFLCGYCVDVFVECLL